MSLDFYFFNVTLWSAPYQFDMPCGCAHRGRLVGMFFSRRHSH